MVDKSSCKGNTFLAFCKGFLHPEPGRGIISYSAGSDRFIPAASFALSLQQYKGGVEQYLEIQCQ
jgi:hypothetical protein